MCALAFRTSYDGSEVMRVFYSVADYDERLFSPLACDFKDILNGAVRFFCDESCNALVIFPSAESVEVIRGGIDYGNSRFLCLGYDDLDRTLNSRYENFVDGRSGFEQLRNGVSSYNCVFTSLVIVAALSRSAGVFALIIGKILSSRASVFFIVIFESFFFHSLYYTVIFVYFSIDCAFI